MFVRKKSRNSFSGEGFLAHCKAVSCSGSFFNFELDDCGTLKKLRVRSVSDILWNLYDIYGPVVQLGERLVRNQEVGGSTPPRSIKNKVDSP